MDDTDGSDTDGSDTDGSETDDSEPLPARFARVRDRTEALAEPLSSEDQAIQSMADVSPTKWHRAHTSWFFETFLLDPELAGYRVFDPAYCYLFNSYYEAVGSRHPRAERGLISRPGVEDVTRYRRHVDHAMRELLARDPAPEVVDLIELGLVHEEQHQELLLMDIKHVLSRNPLRPAYRPGGPTAPPTRAEKAGWIEHPGGDCAVGTGPGGFSFDNERPRHAVHLAPFSLADRSVTCGEWLDFMEDGGYHRPELWLSDGWAAVQAQGWDAPLYWERAAGADGADGPNWSVFTLFGSRPLPPDEPVCHLSLYEADAFAHWAGARLPTEFEWEVALSTPGWSLAPTGTETTEIPDHALHPASPTGSVWEWTSSAYAPYPGFQPAAGAVGEYNGKFMVNQYVLRGGCCATPPGHIRPTYRNFFPAGSRWMFGGLRLARDL